MSRSTGSRSVWTQARGRIGDAWWRVPRWLQVLVVCFAVLAVARLAAEILQG